MLKSLTRRDLGSRSRQPQGAALTAAVAAPIFIPPRRAGAASLLWVGLFGTRSPLCKGLCRFCSLFPRHRCPDGWGKVQFPQKEDIWFSHDIGKSAGEGNGRGELFFSLVFCLAGMSHVQREDDVLREVSGETKPFSAPCKSQPTTGTA